MYEEFDNIMVFIANEVFKAKKEEKGNEKANADFDKLKNDMRFGSN